MEERGFIRDMLDVKVLILFVAAKAKYPLTLQKIYELCYQDDRLSYFDVSIAVPQMVESGHLEQLPDGTYVVTQKGAEQEEVTRDSIAFPVMQRELAAVERVNAQTRRGEFVRSELVEQENGTCTVRMLLDDDIGNLMKLELTAPSKTQGRSLQRAFEQQAEAIYNGIMKQLLRQIKGERITIFSTHLMDLALDLCDEIVLLNHGMLERIDKSNLDSHEFKDKIIAALREEEHA